jgi:hypothetical protein
LGPYLFLLSGWDVELLLGRCSVGNQTMGLARSMEFPERQRSSLVGC